MGCKECGKPKCNGKCGCNSPKVLQINNPAEYITFHKVNVPAAMGDSKTNPPTVGKYKNILLYYEADQTSWIYSTDGIPVRLTNGITNYEDSANLPEINGHTLIGNKTSHELGLQGELTAGNNIQIEGNTISATDTTYTAGDGIEIDGTEVKARIGDGLEFGDNDEIRIDGLEQYAHFFDTVADMQASTDLIDGGYARTIGYYSANDGGSALYHITDTVPSGYYETLGNGLYAQLIADKMNVRQVGAKGDGVTDDTNTIRSAIAFCKANGVSELFIPDGEFVISGTLAIDFSDFAFKGSKGSLLKYVGEGAGTASTGIRLIRIEGASADAPVENILIDGINIDATNQVYKGGHTLETPRVTSTDPCAKGLSGIGGIFVKNLTISNCFINDLYGDGIIFNRSTNCRFINNTLRDVGAGNITLNGQTGYDNHGDAIVAFSSYNVIFENNTVINTRVYQHGMTAAIGKPCGRSGLEFEYPLNIDYTNSNPDDTAHNAPDYDLIPTKTFGNKQYREAYAMRMSNNYVYGYTKAIHLESHVKCLIANNNLLSNHIGVMASIDSGSVFSGNYINPLEVGEAPQSGYNLYFSGIAISEYSAGVSRYGVIVTGNVFEGEGKGVILGSSNVVITDNIFKTERGIYTQQTQLTGIVIENNTFNDTGLASPVNPIFLYNVTSAIVSSNNFHSDNGTKNLISGHNIQIVNNIFDNVAVKHENGGSNISVKGNIFKGESPANIPLFLATIKGSVIDDNIFYANNEAYDDKYVIQIYGKTDKSVFSNNKFYLSTTRGNMVVIRNEDVENSRFINNVVYGNKDETRFIFIYNSRLNIISANILEDGKGNVVYCSGGFWRWNVVESNSGKIYSAGYYPNDSLARLVNAYYNTSDKYYKFNITSVSTTIGWICVSSGFYVTTAWSSSDIAAGTLIKNQSDNVYKCVTKGSGASTVEPTHTTAENVTESDGYEWEYLGAVAVFKNLTI